MDADYGKAWSRKFAIIDKCMDEDGWMPSTEKAKSLSFGERLRMFIIWGFLFSVVYYCIKGMWAKASVMLSASFLLGSFAELVGHPLLLLVSNLALPAFAGGFANLDYYHMRKRNEQMWPLLPSAFGAVWFAVGAPILTGYVYWTTLT